MSQCPQCDGPGMYLGIMGSLCYYRCRNCGWEWDDVMPLDEPEEDEE